MSQYARATGILLAALDLGPSERDAFITRECAGDAALERDVRSLVDAHGRSEGFLESPQTIGDYRILGLLGEGGMGIVYLAEDTRLGRKVALKAIAPHLTHDHHARERLRREARAAATLVHPGIAVVYALEEIDENLFIVSEYVAGETLRDAITGGPLPLEDAISIGRQIADALAAAHDRGVVHRDLKPENVMRTADGTAKILDFGLAKATGAEGKPDLTAEGAMFGTPAYMSPEQLRGESAGPRSDIFSFGVLLAELSSGRHPFGDSGRTATMARVLTSEPDLTGLPPVLKPVIVGCIAKVADERFHSAHEVRAALDTIARGETPRHANRSSAFWWWQFHQAGASVFSVSLAVSIWLAWGWLPRDLAPPILVAAILGGFGATTLRLHQWFSSRMLPPDSRTRRVSGGARANDLILAAAVMVAGLLLQSSHPVAAGFLLASAVVLMFISFVVEPATARAANR